MHFGVDARVAILSYRSWAAWLLGYPDAAFADADQALTDAREIGQATSLMFALSTPLPMLVHCGNYATALKHCDELITLVNEKGALYWKAIGMLHRASTLALTDRTSDALPTMITGINGWRSTGPTMLMPLWLTNLARAYAASANSLTLGAASAKLSRRSKQLTKGCMRPTIVSRAKSR